MKKFFSAFLLMTAMVFSVGTFVSCNDLTDEMTSVQTQATQNAAAISALDSQISALQTALATAQSTADQAVKDAAAAQKAAEAAQKTGDDAAKAAAEAQKAAADAAAAAAQAKADAIAEAKAEVELLKKAYETKIAEVTAALEGKASQAALDAAIEQATKGLENLAAVLNARIDGIEEGLGKLATIAQLEEAVATLVAEDTKLALQIEALKAYSDTTYATIAEAEAIRKELKGLVEENYNELYDLIGKNTSTIGVLVEDTDLLKTMIEGLMEQNQTDHQNILISLMGVIETADSNSLAIAEMREILATHEGYHSETLKTLNTTVDDLSKLTVDFNALKTDFVGYMESNEASINELSRYLSNVISDVFDIQGDVEELQKGLDALETRLNDFEAYVGTMFNALQYQAQSLVFVPEYIDMKATIYQYTLGANPVNNQVIVKATYKVTPSHLAQDVADYKLMPVMFAKQLKTRADAEELAATNVFVTNANPSTGTFDVEAIFTYVDDVDPGMNTQVAPAGWLADNAFALYLCENQAVAADGEEAPAAAPVVSNKITSSYIQVAPAKGTDIAELYVLYNPTLKKEYKDLKAEELNIKMPWCEKNNARTPLAGFDVYVKNGKEYMTIAEAAELFRVPVQAITPLYEDKITYDEKECKVLAVEPDAEDGSDEERVLARTISIVGDVTAANAKDYIGHKVSVAGWYTNVFAAKLPALDVAYSYEIDYRTVILTLTEGADRVEWNYETAVALGENQKPNQKPIDKNFDEKFGEYNVTVTQNAADKVDYKKIIETITPSTIVKLNGVEMTTGAPALVITPVAAQLAEIAAVSVSGYEFSTEGENAYEFVQTYIDATSATKVEYRYALTLGAMPKSPILVHADAYEFQYTDKDTTVKVEFAKLAAEAFAAYLPADCKSYNPKANGDVSEDGKAELFAAETKPVNVKTAGRTNLRYASGDFTLSNENIRDIYLNAKAKSAGYLIRTVKTWYGVNFEYKVPFTITDPAYSISVLPTHVSVDAEGNYYANAVYDEKYTTLYTIKNINLAHYFKVNGLDGKNKVQTRFTIVPVKDAKTSPVFESDNSTTATRTPFEADGAFNSASSIIKWGDYEHLTFDIEAQLVVNGADFGDPVVVTIIAPDPLSLVEGSVVNVARRTNEATTIADIRSGAQVEIIGQDKTIAADAFAKDASKYTQKHSTTYDANVDAKVTKVYYKENGQDVDVLSSNYTCQGYTFTMKPESTPLLIPIYVEVEVVMDYTLDGNKPDTTTVTYVLEYKK